VLVPRPESNIRLNRSLVSHTGTRSSGILIFMVEPSRLPVEVFRRLRMEPDLSVVELRPSGASARLLRTEGRLGVPSVVLRPVGTLNIL